MPAPDRDPPSPGDDAHPSKRPRRQSSPDKDSPSSIISGGATSPTADTNHLQAHHAHDGRGSGTGKSGHSGSSSSSSSSFRNVSACNRCRLRKNRCDQRLPSCASCDKAGVACVGYDPITKREIPRSYIYYLEKRVEQLENLLSANGIAYPPAQDLNYCSKSGGGVASSGLRSPVTTDVGAPSAASDAADAASTASGGTGREPHANGDSASRLPRIASKHGTIGQAEHNRYLGSTTGISFARVVFAAVQSSVSDQRSNSDKGGIRPYRPAPGAVANAGAGVRTGTSMRDSFFGLHTKPTNHPASFPDRELGLRLINLYFEHANPQIPVLHRGEFMEMFERAYADEVRGRGPRELYVLNMVFAIGAGIIVGDSKGEPASSAAGGGATSGNSGASSGSRQYQPEEYHASAIVHLEACLGSSGGLEDLQAVLLLANFALLRPVPPGLWYIIGVAVRLAVDQGLHSEDVKDIDVSANGNLSVSPEAAAKERGKREYIRDKRRRLWWCTYSFDRLVSICVGRPFGISDQVITTEFPSVLDDRYITPDGVIQPPPGMERPSYKLVAHHYFRLRLLQSEILQVLQFRQAQGARAAGLNSQNPYMHKELPSPFLSRFDSFRSWRIDIDRRMWEWKNSAPTRDDIGVAFATEFFDLNYWQAIIMLYRQSLSVPTVFEGEYDTSKEVNNPAVYNAELREDEDRVYLKVAEAGQKILRLYRQLHLMGVVNHTYLTTHHLFVAGISYLYAIWHSPIVRSRLTMDEVDFTILAATSVFTDFMDKCPPAEACRDAFDRTVKATLKMVNASGGFGQQYRLGHASAASSSIASADHSRLDWSARSSDTGLSVSTKGHHGRHHRHAPSVDQLSPAATSDTYSHASSILPAAFQKGAAAQYRVPGGAGGPTIKTEPDGFSNMRNLPRPPRSNASSVDTNPVTPDATTTMSMSPSLMQRQLQQQQLGSPMGELVPDSASTGYLSPRQQPQQQQQQQQQGQQQFSPRAAPPQLAAAGGYTDLPSLGVDSLLRNLNAAASGVGQVGMPPPPPPAAVDPASSAAAAAGAAGMLDLEGVIPDFNAAGDAHMMDLGFGLGWEGVHNDYSDGQQLDLFDGFFFGGGGG